MEESDPVPAFGYIFDNRSPDQAVGNDLVRIEIRQIFVVEGFFTVPVENDLQGYIYLN